MQPVLEDERATGVARNEVLLREVTERLQEVHGALETIRETVQGIECDGADVDDERSPSLTHQ